VAFGLRRPKAKGSGDGFWGDKTISVDDNLLQKIRNCTRLAPMNDPLHARAAAARSDAAPPQKRGRENSVSEKSS
jgi:hypothetical protein